MDSSVKESYTLTAGRMVSVALDPFCPLPGVPKGYGYQAIWVETYLDEEIQQMNHLDYFKSFETAHFIAE